MQRLEVSGAVRPIYGSLGVKRLIPGRDFSKASRLDLVPTQPPIEMILGHISPRVKRLDRKLITKSHGVPR